MPRLAPPPFGGNAFGAFISDNMMQAFAPAELARRAIGDRGQRLNTLRCFKQAEGPHGRFRFGGLWPILLRLAGLRGAFNHGAFGNVAVAFFKIAHAVTAQPYAQPVNQRLGLRRPVDFRVQPCL